MRAWLLSHTCCVADIGILLSLAVCSCGWYGAVGIAATFGIVSGMSESMVGLTILSIGNSVNDLAADVTIARAGFPSMAIAGAYAGPMFSTSAWLLGVALITIVVESVGWVGLGCGLVAVTLPGRTCPAYACGVASTDILFGLGVPLAIEIAKHGTISLGADSLTVNYSLLSAAGFVLFSMVTVAASGFRVTRSIGGCLLALYTAFFVGLVVIQVRH